MNTSALTPGSLSTRAIPTILCLLVSGTLHAQSAVSTPLTGSSEVPPVKTSATGTAQITILPTRTVKGEVSTSGLEPTMAHIHQAAVGKNGPPIITLVKSAGGGFVVPSDTRLTEAQYMNYMAGNLYVNVHSTQHPDGEIRGQLPGKPLRIAN